MNCLYKAAASAAGLVGLAIILLASGHAKAQWDGDMYIAPPTKHERYHEWYKTWKQPDSTTGCCSATEYSVDGHTHVRGDCEPTRAELRAGDWYARLRQHDIDEGWPVWVRIPDEKILRERNPSTEEGHLCWRTNYKNERKNPEGGVLCFVPPDTGG